MFRFEGVEYMGGKDDYIDFMFTDLSPNAIKRLWTLTWNGHDKRFEGTLRRSKYKDTGFDYTVSLPKKMVNKLFDHLPQNKKDFFND